MRIITKRTLREFWERHSTSKLPLMLWYENISKQNFYNLVELRQVFPHADSVGNFTVFNIGGNKYRLITYINYQQQLVFIRNVLTHSEYNQENWKNDDWFNSSK
jgi:mRNA interferase HigB